MKKQRLWFAALSLIFSICLGFCLAACKNDNKGGNAVVPALTAPSVTIDDNGIATWNEVTNASGYSFKIDGGEEQTAENREVRLEDGQCIAVKAKGDGVNYSDSDWSKTETYTAPNVDSPVKLGTPSVAVYKDGKATWGAITNASGYIVKIDEKETRTSETAAQLKNGESISVQAVGNGTSYLNGDFSASKTYKAPADSLAAPENLTAAIQGTDAGKVILSWSAVEGASGYEYIINGSEQGATVEENSVTVDLSEINSSKLDSTWVFRVKALGNNSEEIADDGDYSDRRASSNYCGEVEFAVSNDEIYTVAEILKIINYYGENLPYLREFKVTGTVASNTDGDAVLESGFTLFGEYVPELYLSIDGKLAGLAVTATGTLTVDGEVKGLSSYRSVDFENIAENDRYALVIDTLNAWNMLKEDSKIMSDFYLPVKLYGVNILWTVDDDDTGAFALDKYGDVTVTCPAEGEEDIPVMLSALLYIDDDHMYEEELMYMIAVTAENRIQLATPKININPKTGVATWNEVEHAVRYRYNLYGVIDDDYVNWETKSVDETGYIEAGEKLEIKMYNKLWLSVKAIGDGVTYKDSEVDPKQYNYYPETIEPDGTPLEFDLTKLTQTGELANPTYIFGLACGNSDVFESASATRVELGNSYTTGAVTGTGFIKVGSANNDGKITLNFNKKINGVVICARQWNNDQTDKISVNGSEEQTASKNDWGIMYFNFSPYKASQTVEIDTNNRVFIQSITVYVAD